MRDREPVTDPSLRHLISLLPADRIRADAETKKIYGADWSGILAPAPLAVAFPQSTAEVALILKTCNEQGLAVVPSGGRTGLSGGAVAARGELVLSLEKLNAISEPDLKALTIKVGAGAITQAVHQKTAPLGLTWPVDFASKGSSQVGGNISTNAGGVRVIKYGSTRNWVLGLTAVTMQGEVLSLNGALEKNNTGLDLRHLLIGSEGVLAVITEATLKLCRLPASTQVMFFALRDFPKVIELFRWMRAQNVSLSAFECLSRECFEATIAHFSMKSPLGAAASEDSPGQMYVLVEIEIGLDGGGELQGLEEVFEQGIVEDGVLAQNSREAESLWKIREGVAESVLFHRLVHQQDISVGIADLQSFAAQIIQEYQRAYSELEVFIFGHVGDGNLHVFIRKPLAMSEETFWSLCERSDEGLFRFVARYRGSVSAEHGVGLLKLPALGYSRSPAELAFFKQIKQVFDPQGLLNPGKMIS